MEESIGKQHALRWRGSTDLVVGALASVFECNAVRTHTVLFCLDYLHIHIGPVVRTVRRFAAF